MRCEDVIRELAVPTAESPKAAVADHVAHCPECAAWAVRDAQLGRLWDATRPAEPSAETWDTVWGRIGESLDRTDGDILPMKRPTTSRRLWFVALGAAQIAAAILAVVYLTQSGTGKGPQVAHDVRVKGPEANPLRTADATKGMRDPVPTPPDTVVLAVAEVEIPPGELVVIRKDGDRVKATELAMNGNSVQVDPSFEALNSLEAIAQ